MSAMWHSFRLGWRQGWAQKRGLLSVFSSYLVMIWLWTSLWRAASHLALAKAGLTFAQAAWYSAAGELIFFAGGTLYQDIEQDVRSGEATSFLVRPIGYIRLKLAEAFGRALFKMVFFWPLIALFVLFLTRSFPLDFVTTLLMLPMMVAGAFLWLLFLAIIGMSAAWLPVVRPVYMVFSKITMVLGGLIVPVVLFPSSLQRLAFATPCPAIFYAATSAILDPSPAHVLHMAFLQGLWLAILCVVALMTARRFERRLIAREG